MSRDDAGGYGAPQQGYGAPPAQSYGGRNQYSQGQDSYGAGMYNQSLGSNVEMAPLAQNAGSFGQGDPNSILNECRSIDSGIDEVERNLDQLRMLQDRVLADADTSGASPAKRQLDGRQGQARAALNAVQDRHAEIQRIEQQMVELAQLFQDMDTLVVQQEAAVAQIEQKGEEVAENLDKGNEEIGVAVDTARKTRKKKWWCLGICVLIILIIVGAVVAYVMINNSNKNNNNQKRALDLTSLPIVNSVPVDTDSMVRVFKDKMVRPVDNWQPGANAAGDNWAASQARNIRVAPPQF
ncbi:hypothetical protein BN1723_011711 [Verticillium longisporum]|uniref:t-SNARE coiled-coil homology domain-containing protein n=1 Tax=Verticillium longisporum TaxID=100787 RepID=A0A0G4LAA5_VERLO|nr:hypothetical protein BN1723_011711 [Verticillium longisporum]